ncbi:MAG TPA: methyl-accepting chemotaxis protein [Oligoflexus sp.]|uniref:methyl-accepting chemotaxis protein n=1 Tax=Oligoflexus sp. TaxID=1971216 RepID=UPI002D5DF91E|nr:methyl-accepting chemotaxis protein [Oligoflexus sp.]HYX38177.1 methyl-accepting chemotaxis protein [Oligoflexus sp.]
MRAVSLTSKLLGICTGSLVIMFLACLYSFLDTAEREKEGIRQKWFLMVRDMQEKLGAEFSQRYGDVQVFAQNSVMEIKNTAEITKAFNAYVNIYGLYDLILLVDLNGQVIVTSTVDAKNNALDVSKLSGQNFASSPWFTNVVHERYSEDAKKGLAGVYVEDAMVDPISSLIYKEKRLGMSFSAPIRDEAGKMVAVITSRASLAWVEHRFIDLYENLKKEDLSGTELTLLNKKGEMVVNYDPSTQNANDAIVRDFDNILFKINLINLGHQAVIAAARGEQGVLVADHTRKHIRQVNAFSTLRDEDFLDDLGWILLFRIEEAALLGRILDAKQRFFIISGIVLALCVLGSGFFAIRLSRRLKAISENIARSGDTVDSVSTQLSNASQDLSSGATEVASSLEETVSSLEELTSMVRTNAENAGEAASLAQNSSRIAKDGETEVQSLIGAISEINHSSKKIEEIITVIDEIAFQTNLLALNAAVEAARAGEQGKGFAVVAEAVRNLAQRSGTAAKEITGLIRDNVDKIDRGTKIADRSGQVLQNILSSVRKVADLNNEIAAASREQSSGLSQISKAMNEIDQATQRNAAASEEVAASSEEMSAQATTLQTMVHDLADVITGHTNQVPVAPIRSAHAAAPRKKSNVMPLRRPPARPMSKASPAPGPKPRHHAETVIPFGDEGDDEPAARIGSTSGF